ncbi:hypothetical protein VZG28_05685 [Synechococcus elongatus IITB4]|uniref:hypothetical protein n=1 Tax=Synechococcus elongatus TaxID=32046 RepID=UPI0030CC6CB3
MIGGFIQSKFGKNWINNFSSIPKLIRVVTGNLEEIDNEITERQRSYERSPNPKDQEAIEALTRQKLEKFNEYQAL